VSEPPPGAAAAPALPASAELPARYAQQLAARHWQADEAQRALVLRLEQLRQELTGGRGAALPRRFAAFFGAVRYPAVRGLYLWGAVGRGKTWLMDLFCASLPPGMARRRHFHRFMYDVHERLQLLPQRRAPLEEVARALAREARVLCLDELQVSDIADAMILGTLLAALIRHGVTLVTTSNVPPAGLYPGGLQRQRFLPAIALLEHQLAVVQLDGVTDYRLRELTQAGVYLPSGAPDTPARLAALFARLADQEAAAGGSIEIEGRAIAVVRVSAAVAWFEFAALCAGPRSQNDYIEIAREFQSLIVANVPLLGPQQDDEARRFIALIDELYDRCVNLVISAAAPAAALYRGERLRAAFERTVSRLTEMQSAAYLAREHRP